MTRPLILDGCCCAGGAGMGYYRAGFDVLGVDNRPQPRYPFPMVQADIIDALTHWDLSRFAAVHVSPPCQDHMRNPFPGQATGTGWILAEVRRLLVKSGVPWVIENVPGSPLRADYKLCGCMFGLRIERGRLERERWFETSWQGFALRPPCLADLPAIAVVGRGTPPWVRKTTGPVKVADRRRLLDCPWMNRDELSQAIPPAYTEYLGAELLDALGKKAA